MIVYRLEDRETQHGPFSSDRKWPKAALDSPDSVHQNAGCTLPMDIKYGPMSDNFRFGARNITQLKKYWVKNMKHFLNDGWVVAAYKVRKNYVVFAKIPKIDVEVAFDIRKAERIGVVGEKVL